MYASEIYDVGLSSVDLDSFQMFILLRYFIYSSLFCSSFGDIVPNVPNRQPSIASVCVGLYELVPSLNIISHRSHVNFPTNQADSNGVYCVHFAFPLNIDFR